MTSAKFKQTLAIARGERPAMTPEKYQETIDAIGMSQVAAAEFFCVSVRTGQRWAWGEVPVPLAVAQSLEYMRKG